MCMYRDMYAYVRTYIHDQTGYFKETAFGVKWIISTVDSNSCLDTASFLDIPLADTLHGPQDS